MDDGLDGWGMVDRGFGNLDLLIGRLMNDVMMLINSKTFLPDFGTRQPKVQPAK